MGMLGRCFSISLLLLLVFALSLNALQCMNFQINEHINVKDGYHNKTEPKNTCTGCTNYICKVDDKIIRGGECTEKVKETCAKNWNETKVKSIAQEEKFQFEKDQFFVFSCNESFCNNAAWMKKKMNEYNGSITDAGLYVEIPPPPPPTMPRPTFCDPENAERLNEMSNGLACISQLEAKQVMVCRESGGCICFENSKGQMDPKDGFRANSFTEVSCDNNPKLNIFECEPMSDGQKELFNKEALPNACPINPSGAGSGGDGSPGGAEAVGYGFALLIAPIFASLFLL